MQLDTLLYLSYEKAQSFTNSNQNRQFEKIPDCRSLGMRHTPSDLTEIVDLHTLCALGLSK